MVEYRQNVELSKEDFIKVKDYSKKLNITFFATPFDIPDANFLIQLICQHIKLHLVI